MSSTSVFSAKKVDLTNLATKVEVEAKADTSELEEVRAAVETLADDVVDFELIFNNGLV